MISFFSNKSFKNFILCILFLLIFAIFINIIIPENDITDDTLSSSVHSYDNNLPFGEQMYNVFREEFNKDTDLSLIMQHIIDLYCEYINQNYNLTIRKLHNNDCSHIFLILDEYSYKYSSESQTTASIKSFNKYNSYEYTVQNYKKDFHNLFDYLSLSSDYPIIRSYGGTSNLFEIELRKNYQSPDDRIIYQFGENFLKCLETINSEEKCIFIIYFSNVDISEQLYIANSFDNLIDNSQNTDKYEILLNDLLKEIDNYINIISP